MNIETIRVEALSLPVKARSQLAEQLLSSLDSMPDAQQEADIEPMWLQVAMRRAAELDQGHSKRVSAAEVSARAQ